VAFGPAGSNSAAAKRPRHLGPVDVIPSSLASLVSRLSASRLARLLFGGAVEAKRSLSISLLPLEGTTIDRLGSESDLWRRPRGRIRAMSRHSLKPEEWRTVWHAMWAQLVSAVEMRLS